METPDCGTAEVGEHIQALRREGELLAGAVTRAGLRAPVPSCPGWDVADLLRHVGFVHRWASGYVAGSVTSMVDVPGEADVLTLGPGDDVLLDWFRAGHADLVRALDEADPRLDCWTFLAAASPRAFWARRQAHETTIHRVDVEQALAGGAQPGPGPGPAPGPIPARLAADGVDELLTGFLPRNSRRTSWRHTPGTLALHADDGAGAAAHWLVTTQAGRVEVARGPGPADCDVTGRAAVLYLLLWNRGGTQDLDVRGDASHLAALRDQLRVTWRR